MTTTHTTKWEDLEPEKIVENYIRLKILNVNVIKKAMKI